MRQEDKMEVSKYPFGVWVMARIELDISLERARGWARERGGTYPSDLTLRDCHYLGLRDTLTDAAWEDEDANTDECGVTVTAGLLGPELAVVRMKVWVEPDTDIRERLTGLVTDGVRVSWEAHLIDPAQLEDWWVSGRVAVAPCGLPPIAQLVAPRTDLPVAEAIAILERKRGEEAPCQLPEEYRRWVEHPGVVARPYGTLVALEIDGETVAYVGAATASCADAFEVACAT